jgi:hypothetical protein
MLAETIKRLNDRSSLSSFPFHPSRSCVTRKRGYGEIQISSWATYGGATIAHVGYYVVDTVTGKVMAEGSEILTRDE